MDTELLDAYLLETCLMSESYSFSDLSNKEVLYDILDDLSAIEDESKEPSKTFSNEEFDSNGTLFESMCNDGKINVVAKSRKVANVLLVLLRMQIDNNKNYLEFIVENCNLDVLDGDTDDITKKTFTSTKLVDIISDAQDYHTIEIGEIKTHNMNTIHELIKSGSEA